MTHPHEEPMNIGLVALQIAIAESVARQANVNTGAALQIVELVFEQHLGDAPTTHTAHQILLESVEAAIGAEALIKKIQPSG